MVYPDLWGLGEYEVPNPEAQPYDIVSRSLLDFQMPSSRWAGRWSRGCRTTPATSPTAAAEVQAQMQAAKDRGIDNWLFWDPDTEYTIDAYPTAS